MDSAVFLIPLLANRAFLRTEEAVLGCNFIHSISSHSSSYPLLNELHEQQRLLTVARIEKRGSNNVVSSENVIV